jgi:hypothetical protein
MIEQTLHRAADVFFTVCLLLMAGFGVALVWATGDIRELSLAMLSVALVAPAAYRRRPQS